MQSEGLSHRGKVNLFGPFARVQLQFVIENCVLEQYYKTALTHQGIDTAIQCTVLSVCSVSIRLWYQDCSGQPTYAQSDPGNAEARPNLGLGLMEL